ncbi:MAG: porin [Cellvibrionales bacterium]|nr:porin [Cellvibrionales bacterium]
MENEKPVIEIATNDGKQKLRTVVYLQPRIEYGDLIQGASATVVSNDVELYFRRASIGFYGSALSSKLKFGVTLSGDQTPEDEIYPGYSENALVSYDTYVSYKLIDSLNIRFGKEKLPYSRSYLVSSSRQIFSERPYYAMTWGDVLHSYTSTHLSLHDNRFPIRYSLSVAKPWRSGEKIYENVTLTGASPQYSARVTWSPVGWEQEKLSDTHMGQGRHLSFGLYAAYVDALEYENAGVEISEERLIYGLDLSFHLNSFQFTAEVNGWQIDAPDSTRHRETLGWVAQTAYFFPEVKLEPTLRIEQFDSNKDANHSDVEKYTMGLNKYLNENNLKLNLDIEYTDFDNHVVFLKPQDKNNSLAIRLTGQLIL